jgi:hypothetical protein
MKKSFQPRRGRMEQNDLNASGKYEKVFSYFNQS